MGHIVVLLAWLLGSWASPALAKDLIEILDDSQRSRTTETGMTPVSLFSFWSGLRLTGPETYQTGTLTVILPDAILAEFLNGNYLLRGDGKSIVYSAKGTLEDSETLHLRECTLAFTWGTGATVQAEVLVDEKPVETMVLNPAKPEAIVRFVSKLPKSPARRDEYRVLSVHSDSRIGFLVHLKKNGEQHLAWFNPQNDYLLRGLHVSSAQDTGERNEVTHMKVEYLDDHQQKRTLAFVHRGAEASITVRSDRGEEMELLPRNRSEAQWIESSLREGIYQFQEPVEPDSSSLSIFGPGAWSYQRWRAHLSEFKDPFSFALKDDLSGLLLLRLWPNEIKIHGTNTFINGTLLGNRTDIRQIREIGSKGYVSGAVMLRNGSLYSPSEPRLHDLALVGSEAPEDLAQFAIAPGGGHIQLGEKRINMRELTAEERARLRREIENGTVPVTLIPEKEKVTWLLRNPVTGAHYVVTRSSFPPTSNTPPKFYSIKGDAVHEKTVLEFVMDRDGGSLYLRTRGRKFIFLPPYLGQGSSLRGFGRTPFLASVGPLSEDWLLLPPPAQRTELEIVLRATDITTPESARKLHERLNALGIRIDDTFPEKHSCAYILSALSEPDSVF